MMQLFFALTLLVSATLLFFVQPMFAKMVLPRLGGTPAVWNTCMVFYQAALLAGYLYAHFSTKWLRPRRQAILHLALLGAPWLVLPIAVRGGEAWASELTVLGSVGWLLWMLSLSVGLSFFVVSATAPMLQTWFADTGHPSGKDPYFLYAASNLGSMLALIGYPLFVEPYLPLAMQAEAWRIGYAVLVLLIFGCAVLLWASRGAGRAAAGKDLRGGDPAAELPVEIAADATSPEITASQRLRWLVLAFAPSSLMLGVTNFISVDLASVPLLWVIPLALYLLTFVLVFSRLLGVARLVAVRIQPVIVAALAVLFSARNFDPLWVVMLVHLTAFFVTSLVCHGELASSRPSTKHLTEFYIWMSVGGVLGGLFNAMVAPLVFTSVVEYPLIIALACILRPKPAEAGNPARARWLDLVLPLWLWFALKVLVSPIVPAHSTQLFGLSVPAGVIWLAAILVLAGTAAMAFMFRSGPLRLAMVGAAVVLAAFVAFEQGVKHEGSFVNLWRWVDQVTQNSWFHLPYDKREFVVLGVGAIVALAFMARPLRFGMGIGAVLLAGQLWYSGNEDVILQTRSFFGVMRVKYDKTEETHTLVHGSTTHGMQSTNPEKCHEPLTYYHHDGPLGRVFDELIDPKKHKQIGVIGLGTGTIAAYAHKGQEFTYFEIDPEVVRIAGAEDPDATEPASEEEAEERTEAEANRFYYFTYVYNARADGAKVHVVLGDARLSLVDQPDGRFDLLAVDAFSSDAIPIHLLTRESLALYFQKLAPDGILMVHISNRYMDLAPVVGNLARDAGLTARVCSDGGTDETGKFGSEWVAIVRKPGRLGELLDDYDWEEIPPDDRVGIWTDDFSNIMGVLRWWKESKLAAWLEGRTVESAEETENE